MFNAPVDWLPPVARLPDQSPLATHDVALAVVQFIVDDPPWTTADGAAVSVTVGGDVADVTVTSTRWLQTTTMSTCRSVRSARGLPIARRSVPAALP